MKETKDSSKKTNKMKKVFMFGSENEFQILYSIMVLVDIVLVIAFGIRILGEVVIELEVEYWILIVIILTLFVDKIKTALALAYQSIVNITDFLSQKVLEENPKLNLVKSFIITGILTFAVWWYDFLDSWIDWVKDHSDFWYLDVILLGGIVFLTTWLVVSLIVYGTSKSIPTPSAKK